MITLRPTQPDDLDYLIASDLLSDGWTPTTEDVIAAHHAKIAAFVAGGDDTGWIAEDDQTGERAGMILVRFRDRYHEPPTDANLFLFRALDDAIFPASGRFCEVYQLWVGPTYRRQGIATRLKQQIEVESLRRGIEMIYTHTEARNEHVIELNQKLGYRIVRTGPIWDEVPRTSLVKWLMKA